MGLGPRHDETDPGRSTDGMSEPLARRLPSGILGWAVFQPNAPGRRSWSSRGGFVQRQLLKSRGLCPAERVFVAVGSAEVRMWHALPGRFVGRSVGRWDRHDLVAEAVDPSGVGSAWWPAVRLHVRHRDAAGRRRLLPVAELRAVHDDTRSAAVAELLVRGPDPR